MNDGSEGDETDTPEAVVRGYYEAIDAKNYERFADLLAPEVVHERPDRTIEGRETLVGFMRDDRPNKDTSHEVEAVYRRTGGDSVGSDSVGGGGETVDETEADDDDGEEYAVRGRLLDADGNPMFAFVDVFEVENANEAEATKNEVESTRNEAEAIKNEAEADKIVRIWTYTR